MIHYISFLPVFGYVTHWVASVWHDTEGPVRSHGLFTRRFKGQSPGSASNMARDVTPNHGFRGSVAGPPVMGIPFLELAFRISSYPNI